MKELEIRRAIESAWEKVQTGSPSVLLFKTGDTHRLCEELEPILHTLNSGNIIRYAAENLSLLPYSSVIQLIRDRISSHNEISLDHLKAWGVYPPIIPDIYRLIHQLPISFREEVPRDEISFEQLMIRQAWILILRKLYPKPTIVLAEGADRLSHATLQFIRQLAEEETGLPFLLLLTVNHHHTLLLDKDGHQWSNFYSSSTFILDDVLTDEESEPEELPPYSISRSIQCIERAMVLSAYKDVIDLCSHIYPQLETPSDRVFISEQVEIVRFWGLALYYLQEYNPAFLYFSLYLYFAQELGDAKRVVQANRYLAQISLENEDFTGAEAFIEKVLNREDVDQVEQVYIHFVLLLYHSRTGAYNADFCRRIFKEFIGDCHRLEFRRMEIFGYLNLSFYDEEEPRRQQELMEKGLELARGSQNLLRLAAGYHALAMEAVWERDSKKAFSFFEMSREIKEEIGNNSEMAFYHNGIGYFNTLLGHYGTAQEHLYAAQNYLRETNNFLEIGMVLYNQSFNFVMGENYQGGLQMLKWLVSLLNVLGIRDLPYHSAADIQALAGIAAFLGNVGPDKQSYPLIIKLQGLRPGEERPQERLLFHLVFVLSEMDTHQKESACYHAAEVMRIIRVHSDTLYFFLPLCSRVFHSCWTRAEPIVEKLEELISQYPSPETPEYQELVLKKEYASEMSWILKAAKMHRSYQYLIPSISRYGFLNVFQKTILRFRKEYNLFRYAVRLIRMNFVLEHAILYEFHHEEVRVCYTSTNLDTDALGYLGPEIKGLRHASTLQDAGILHRFQEILPDIQEGYFFDYTSVGGRRLVLLLTCSETKNTPLDNDLETIGLAVRLLGMVWERILQSREIEEKNALLVQAVRTDGLTGLHNRTSLENRFEEEKERSRRYDGYALPISLLFIDLDNFKYYNDHFGHHMGDLLLQKVAQLLKTTCRKIDFVSRFGGDEFVILLPNTHESGAREMAERIVNLPLISLYLKDLFSSHLGFVPEIPKNSELTFSIGVVTCDNERCRDLETLLARADKALYLSKEKGKNTYEVSSETDPA